MSELAFNINGEAFEVPANATGWRVRRMRGKGAPEVVYGRDGLPLVLPISAQMDELRGEVGVTGRYRLDPIDQNNKSIEGAPCGYVQVNFETQPAVVESPSITPASFGKPSDNIVIESMRQQSLVALACVEKFPQMMEAAATLLRAADGAGLPARPPMAVPEQDEEDDDDDGEYDDEPRTKSGGFDIVALLTPVLPLVMNGLVSGKLKLGDLGSLFDWRKAQPKPPADEPPQLPASSATQAPAAAMPSLDVAQARRFIEIQQALTPEEATLARQAAANLSPVEVATWLKELSSVSLDEAVAKIRAHINGGAS